jgi:hypothetical protein
MIALPTTFPFSRLKLPSGEVLQWVGYNPTFHRFFEYGLAITNVAFYVSSPRWLIARWRRYALTDIADVTLDHKARQPSMHFRVRGRTIRFRAPYDSHSVESQFDWRVLAQALEQLQFRLEDTSKTTEPGA